MLNMEKTKARKRIKEEFKDVNININFVTFGLVNEDNLFEWQSILKGPYDTSYAGGLFIIRIKFPEDYPERPPEVCFKTPIYHININPKKPKSNVPGGDNLGHVCISTLNCWKPEYTMREVMTDIFALFYMGNPDNSYGMDRADEYRNNKNVYEEKIKYFTKKYADPSVLRKEYDSDWDFSFS